MTIVMPFAAVEVTYFTYGTDTYDTSWVPLFGDTSAKVNIKACSDAYFTLSKIQGNSRTLSYEIGLDVGGEGHSVIRDSVGGSTMTQYDESVLHCDHFKHFWVTWTRGVIEVGKGSTVGVDRILQWQDSDPHDVNAMALKSSDSIEGTFKFHYERNDGKCQILPEYKNSDSCCLHPINTNRSTI